MMIGFGRISIHAPRGGSDLLNLYQAELITAFQSTLPAGGATLSADSANPTPLFQSTLPAGGATRPTAAGQPGGEFQSTLPAGGATVTILYLRFDAANFNPRSPRGERQYLDSLRSICAGFQSTLPAGGATHSHICQAGPVPISIHAPRGGSDKRCSWTIYVTRRFQSTLPAGGATEVPEAKLENTLISIHAPRGGSDLANLRPHPKNSTDFNPRSPRGERRK